ncbi:hypothetical protein [Clostridium sp.]|uniref:hypothetical protein n=1 Tax=Clostridium sp. TaxID=1506 RepID=UPI0025B9A814|nr:hypothetical protein [Clostridium sp.]
MKKRFFYIITIILGAIIPIYYLLIWEPLKSEEVISNNSIGAINENVLNDDEVSNGKDISSDGNKKKIDNNKNGFNNKGESNIRKNSNYNENILNNKKEIEAISIKQSDIENNLFAELEKSEKLEIDRMLKSLSIVDIVKVNDYFSDKYDNDNIREGFLLVKKRMSLLDYEEFKNILSRYTDLDIIEEKIL